MKLPELKIGTKIAKVPIVQGGMAIRLSTARLAAAVANEGGIGLIAASGMSHEELRYEIRLARSLTSGIIGINIMVAARDFAGVVKTAIKEGIDLIVAGAGFSRDMFGYGKESGTPIVPIVSSVKLAKISERLGATAIVVEGKEAGGHLGTSTSVRELIPGIRAAVKIPVIAAGGVLSGQDIVDFIKMGANGVQMGSRFAASAESNAAPALKEYYLKSKPEDIVVIHSPVGLPGRRSRHASWRGRFLRRFATPASRRASIISASSARSRARSRAMWRRGLCSQGNTCRASRRSFPFMRSFPS